MPHSEPRGRNAPAPPSKAISHPSQRPWGLWLPDLLALLLGGDQHTTPHGYLKAPRKAFPHSESGGRNAPAPLTKTITHPSQCPWGLWRPDLQALFLGGALYAPSPWHPDAPCKALPHFEYHGRNASVPFTKAIAHSSRGPWGLWRPELLALLLGGDQHTTPHGCLKAPHKALPRSESRGRNAPAPLPRL